MALSFLFCVSADAGCYDYDRYTSFSRFTDPGAQAEMLDALPDSPEAIAAVAKKLTVHHNLLAHYDLAKDRWSEVESVWPPRASKALSALAASGPGDLLGERQITERLRGACMSESHLLVSMVRYRRIPVRVRAGYFRDVYNNDEEHIVAFWEKNARAKGVAAQLLEEDPQRWREVNHEYTRKQVADNKCVEHWVAEYWDNERHEWRLLDANDAFLKAMSDIDVGFHLPRRHFEFAFEAWQKMRSAGQSFNPAQYAEWPQDGRSHIRSQLLWDFYSLLNHDIAGYDTTAWPEEGDTTPEREVYAFIKERNYEDLSQGELAELDGLAELLSRDPGISVLVTFYKTSKTLQISTISTDPYSFVARSK